MKRIGATGAARIAGCIAGVALALALLGASRPASGGEAIGAELSLSAAPSGELAVTPANPTPFAMDRALRPGDAPVRGAVHLVNQTGRRLGFTVRALPSSPELNELLVMSVSSGGVELAAGRLAELKNPSPGVLELDPGEGTEVAVSAWLPPEAGEGAAAALVDVALHFEWRGPRR